MTRNSKKLSLIAAVSMLAFGCGDDAAEPDEPDSVAPAVERDLIQLREEEKLARDVYLRMFDAWGTQVFSNIASSEQRHMDAVKVHLDALGIPDPVVDDTVGVFTDAALGALYVELTEQGLASQVAALEVGATIEDLDIYDIQLMMGHTDDAGILDTYSNLLCGSGNHMRAFTGQLEGAGATYSPQFISADEYGVILGAEHQMCGQH